MVFFVDQPFAKKKEAAPEGPVPEHDKGQQFDNLPVDAEQVEKNRNGRVAYLEAREAVELERKELGAARETLAKEIREMCRPEIDDYIDCCVGRVFSMMACKPHAVKMRLCIKKIETPEFIERRISEILSSRDDTGESLVNNARKGSTRERRALYNRAILPNLADSDDIGIRTRQNEPDRRA